MFFKIIGWLWIILGIWWIMRPQGIKRRFTKMVKRSRRKVLFIAIILFGGFFFAAAKHAQGFIASILLILGVLAVLKAVFFMTSKASDKILDWWLERPLWLWRVWAGCLVLLGILLQRIR